MGTHDEHLPDTNAICSKCREEGEKSTVEIGPSGRTLMYFVPFYDEEGRYHHHDRNTTTTLYKCSRGHEWVNRSKGRCWCGWDGNS